MTTVIERPLPAMKLECLSESNPEYPELPLSFDFLEYQAGTKIALPSDFQAEELNVLAEGSITVKVLCSLGESTLHVFKPGDVLKLSSIAAISAPGEGTPSHIQTEFIADGKTRIFSLKQAEIERMFRPESKLTFKLVQEMMKQWHGALLKMNAQCSAISNYIYG